ncbi:hypothetical protein KM92DES2_11951 [uncultured Desulfovibrio sp.]|uniref:Uncharacterized protein n=1 Tax=uncultured Desulfovibrio sp. TaxID=167968 RepID=A0A212JYU5_9BACT|nr:hypothetical protein KM92DES2_11951 [uncultured Desulfovibrio sp.]
MGQKMLKHSILVSTQMSILRKRMRLYLYCLCPPAPVAVFATREPGLAVVSGHAPLMKAMI